MSKTESVQHGSEYWRYTAQAMDELLTETLEKNIYAESGFHDRLLDAALEFLSIALGTDALGRNEDPSASIANFGLAARALRDVNSQLAISESEIQKQLSGFVRAIESLRDQGVDAAKNSALSDLQQFFQHVFEAADSQSYVSLVFDNPKMHTL